MSTRTASIRQLQQESTKRNTGQRGIPAPFAQAPSELEPFLRTLQKSKLYIVHLDKVPWQFKRKIFSVPLLTNFALASLIAWRLFVIVPFYRDLFFAAIGYDNDVLMDRTEKATGTLIWLTLERALSLLFDYLLIAFAAPWVATFFFGMPSNPALWRWRIGFRDTEIVVRVSQKWGTAEFWEGFTAVPQTNEQGNAVMKNRIMPAVDPQWMHGRTSYLMMGKDFNLDFASMVNATNLTRKGTMKESSFEKTVLVYSETHGWLAWEVHRLDEGSEEEARKKIILFKDRLSAMGKESLFFRWIELIQYESSQPGGFIPQRQADAVSKAKQLFENAGVDFEEFMHSIGGLDGVPGLAPADR